MIPYEFEQHWSAFYVERTSHDDPFSTDLTDIINGLLVWTFTFVGQQKISFRINFPYIRNQFIVLVDTCLARFSLVK